MYPSAQLHCAQNADDKLFVPAGYQSSNAPSVPPAPSSLAPSSLYGGAIEFLPFRHSISGAPLGDAVPPRKSSLLSAPSPREKRGSPPLTPRSGKIISFIAIPLLFDSSLCARQWNVPFSEHAGMLIRRATINRLLEREREREDDSRADTIIPPTLPILSTAY